MSNDIAKRLLKDEPVGVTDAARLVLEMLEGLGERVKGLTRGEMMEELRRVVRAGTECVRQSERTVSFRELVAACIEFKKERLRPVSLRDLKNFTNRLLRVPGLAERPVRSLTPTDCRAALEQAFAGSAHSYRKGRAILHGLFSFARRRQWCGAENPVDCIEAPVVQEREIVPLRLEEIGRLMRATERPEFADMRLSVYLMTYCGIRPAEVARMSPDDLDFEEGVVHVRPQSSKTGGGRIIPLRRANLLRGKPLLIPKHWLGHWRRLRRAAGFTRWVPDVLRHTFASYHLRHFADPQRLQAEMGHRDSSLLRTRYANVRGIKSREAKGFW